MRTRRPVKRDGSPVVARRYGRVSTEEQNRPGASSIEDQDTFTAEFVARKVKMGEDWTDAGFQHDEFTGTEARRPGWDEIVAASKPGDVVVVHKLDRFARSSLEGLTEIDRLEKMGVDVVIVYPELDTTTPMGKAIRTILLAFAQLDRDLIIDRMSRGAYGKARKGGWPSSHRAAPFGFRVEGDEEEARLVLDEAETRVIVTAADLLVDREMSKGEASRELNRLGLLPRNVPGWYPDLLARVMREPARRGEVIWGKVEGGNASGQYGDPVLIPGVPRPISPERWEQVQIALRRDGRTSAARSPERAWPLSGTFLLHGERTARMASPCGLHYTGQDRPDLGTWYKCKGKKWRNEPGWKCCECTRLRADETEARVWSAVCDLIGSPARLRELADAYLGIAGEDRSSQAAELASLERGIADLEQRLAAGIAQAVKAGLDAAAMAGAFERLQAELAGRRDRRDAIARSVADGYLAVRKLDVLGELAARAGERLAGASPAEQLEVIRLLDIRVTVLDPATRAPELRIVGTVTDEVLLRDPTLARSP